MATLSISQLLDFVKATTDLWVGDGGKKTFQNDASINTNIWGKLAYGWADKLYANAGKSVRAPIILQDNGSFRSYKMGGSGGPYTDAQVIEEPQFYMRFTQSHMTYRDQELLFNEGGGGDGEFTQAVNLYESKVTAMKTAHWNGLDAQCFAVPDPTLMEGDGSTQSEPFSVWTWLNEFDNGLMKYTAGGDFTTIAGIDPSTAAFGGNYERQTEEYDSITAAGTNNILEALDEIIEKVNWQLPADDQQYFANPEMQRLFMMTSPRGHTVIKNLNRVGQDTWMRFGDSGVKILSHAGIPIYRAPQMATSAVYDDGSSGLATEDAADTTGPRVLAINGNYMRPTCHADRFWEMMPAEQDPNDDEKWVVKCKLWWQLINTSPRHHGIVSPGTSV